MKLRFLIAAPLAFAAFFALAGCSSSNSSSGTFYCSDNSAGFPTCNIYKNLTSQQESEVGQVCTAGSGTSVNSCPTSGLLGCCSQTVAGITSEACYYSSDGGVTASQAQSACTMAPGTWSTTQ